MILVLLIFIPAYCFVCADKAPSPLVSLVGRKDYEKCAQDIYLFLQVNILGGTNSY